VVGFLATLITMSGFGDHFAGSVITLTGMRTDRRA